MHDYEPNAVANKTFKSWLKETMESCILNDHDRQCNFKDGDIIDHPLVNEVLPIKQPLVWFGFVVILILLLQL